MTDTIDPPPPAAPPEGSDDRLDQLERLDHLEKEVQAYRISRDSWTLFVLGAAFVVLIGSILAVGFALRDDDDGGGGAAAVAPITADLSEFDIVLSSASIVQGGSVIATNTGTMAHDIGVEGTDLLTEEIQPGESATLDLSSLEPGSYTLYCDVAGHAASGMETPLTITPVGEAATAEAAAASDDAAAMDMTDEEHAAMGGMTAEEAAAMDQAMIDSILAFPTETEGKGNQVLEPTVLEDGTLHFDLTASIIDWEVTPGKIVQAWAYNGMVPGPRINVGVGDTVEVTINNELPIGTDIHWHGIDVPNDQDGVAPITQDMVMSGESYTYRFTTTEPAIGMYHAHAHGELTVPNGLFGAFYVGEVAMPTGQTVSGIDIPDDIEIAQDITMVVNDAGEIGLTLNGKGFPATEPYVVTEGDWIKVTYFNEGLQVHPMHLHGFEQIVYAKDGEPLDSPYAADTILVAPGERYTVLVHPDVVGTWVWHCHILNHVESEDGMFGMVTALIVQPADGATADTAASGDPTASSDTAAASDSVADA